MIHKPQIRNDKISYCVQLASTQFICALKCPD